MSRHIMIDIETLGTRPGAAVSNIGAVEFDPFGIGLGRAFYARIDIASCIKAGLHMEVETVKWWFSQGDEARAEITSNDRESLYDSLIHLASFISGPDGHDIGEVMLWANGASFDFPILSEAFHCAGVIKPWRYYNERDYRTVVKVGPRVSHKRQGTHHNALDDAIHQATHLQKIFAQLHQIDQMAAA